jgi:hypothetical protein
MAKAQLYILRLGYMDIGVGTISQVQAAQKALEALQLVDRHFLEEDDGNQRVLVEADDTQTTSVSRFTGDVLSKEQYRRKSIRKIEHRKVET